MDVEEQSDLIEVAAGWLAALDAGTGDPTAFEEWRAADPRHAAAFAQVAATWSRLSVLARSGIERPAAPPSIAPSLDAVDAQPPVSRRRWLQVASAVVAVSLTGIGARAVARSSADTAVGERRSIRIDDGLRLDLNTDTDVQWRSGLAGRHLWLSRGEIALDVSTGPEVTLSAADARVGLTPGRYNVRLRNPSSLELLVLRGRCTLEASGTTKPAATTGEKLLIAGGTARTRPASGEETDRADAWRRGELAFNDQSLRTVIDDYNRYLITKLRIDDPRIAALRLGGRFTSTDPTDFLAALTASFDVAATRRGDVILIGPAKKRTTA